MKVTTLRVLGERPTRLPYSSSFSVPLDAPLPDRMSFELPPGWIVYNAPRPLFGSAVWQGEFLHGVFYAAIDPTDTTFAADWTRRNVELDGWLVEWLPRDATLRAYAEELKLEYPESAEFLDIAVEDAIDPDWETGLAETILSGWREKYERVETETDDPPRV